MKNMKFKVDSPEQSERLVSLLEKLGYVEEDWECGTTDVCILCYEAGTYGYYAKGPFESYSCVATDTAAFLAAHQPAPAQEPETYFGDDAKELGWFPNTGTMPDLPAGTEIDIVFSGHEDGKFNTYSDFDKFYWYLSGSASDITKWRFHRLEVAEYFKQPKTTSTYTPTVEDIGKRVGHIYHEDGSVEIGVVNDSTTLFEGIAASKEFTKEAAHEAFAGVKRLDAQGNQRLDCATYDDEGNMLNLKVGSLSSLGEPVGHLVTGTIDCASPDAAFTWKVDSDGHVKGNSFSEQPKRNKYMREIKPGVFCDVYDLLRAFNVTDGALAHMVKKCLAVGQRGHKDATEDYKDIVASAQRALELHLEWKDTQ
jgi:hypothetical protein